MLRERAMRACHRISAPVQVGPRLRELVRFAGREREGGRVEGRRDAGSPTLDRRGRGAGRELRIRGARRGGGGRGGGGGGGGERPPLLHRRNRSVRGRSGGPWRAAQAPEPRVDGPGGRPASRSALRERLARAALPDQQGPGPGGRRGDEGRAESHL